MSTATFACPCGQRHPIGFVCREAARQTSSRHQHEHEHGAIHRHAESCSGHEHHHTHPAREHEHTHAEGCGCGHVHTEAAPIDHVALGKATATRALYCIVNMDCPMEETLIRKKLAGVAGITGLEFNLMQRVLTVHHNLPSTRPIEEALTAIDMTPEPLGLNAEDAAATASDVMAAPRIPWRKLAVAGVFAALSEALELLIEWQALPAGPGGWLIAGEPALTWLPLILALAAIALSGLGTYRKGWLAVSNANLNINALMSVAVTGAVLIGQFPEAAMVMVLFNVSEAIEARALDRARNAIRDLLALAPERATMLDSDGTWRERDIRDIAVGSRVRVRPGEKVGLDGLVLEGRSTINQAPITGESMPVEKTPGDVVYAGTINESGSFEFEVTAGASQSTLARIIHAVEEAQGSRAPIQRFVDQFARVYTPAVFAVALLAALLPPLALGAAWLDSVYTALVILVIGCPCALVISTPVSLVSGMAAATRHGILIKGGAFLEQGRKLAWLALDKTGTITHGKPRQTDFVPVSDMEEHRMEAVAASLAGRSDHPVSRAVAEHAEQKVTPLDVTDFAAIPGQGVRGVVLGQTWYLGNHRMVEEHGACGPALEEQIFRLEKEGKSVVALVEERADGSARVHALFAVADTVRDSSRDAIQDLHRLGVKTVMLTGDNAHTAEAIARQVGVDDWRGNLLPQDKLAALEELIRKAEQDQRGGVVGMVGDGINDAPALARAHVGFAMAGGGTDAAMETADVALMDDDLRKIPRFLRLSRATHAILVQNISLALGVKALFFALTLTGHATMWMAVFADVGAALLVVANGLRAMRL